MRKIGTTSGGLYIVEMTEGDLASLLEALQGLQGVMDVRPSSVEPLPELGADVAAVLGVLPKPARKAKVAAAGGERRCIICDRPLPAKAIRGQVTCGSAPCKKQHQSNLARKWYLKRKAEGKAAAVKAPTAVREAASAPVVDKEARRELIRRLAEKKGLAGDADTAVGPVNDPTYVR